MQNVFETLYKALCCYHDHEDYRSLILYKNLQSQNQDQYLLGSVHCSLASQFDILVKKDMEYSFIK